MSVEMSRRRETGPVNPRFIGNASDLTIRPAGDYLGAAETPWDVVMASFLSSRKSDGTRRAYDRHIRNAMEWFGVETLAELNLSMLVEFSAEVGATVRHSPSTQAQRLSALRSFLVWSGKKGAHRLPREEVRDCLEGSGANVQKPYTPLGAREVVALRSAAKTARDKAIVAVLLGAGVRVSECVDLDVSDVIEDSEEGAKINVRFGKGRKSREVPIHPEVTEPIRDYLVATRRRLGDSGPLFRAHDLGNGKRTRNRLTARAVGLLVARLASRAGLDAKHVSPHSLRHTFAIRALRNGATVVEVKRLLGHASIMTTERYLDHVGLADLRKVIPHLPEAIEAA